VGTTGRKKGDDLLLRFVSKHLRVSVVEPRVVFAHNVRRCRENVGLTQESLGHAAGLHPTEISRLERGTRDPRLATIVQIAGALGVATDKLLAGVDATRRGPLSPPRDE
jgi:transcriptional regulator with XRE-family HTH domain